MKQRSGYIKRSRVKRKPRKAEDSERVYGTQEFRDHLHATPCLGCGQSGKTIVQQAHFGKHGTGTKNDWTRTGPLCRVSFLSGKDGCHNRWDRRASARDWFTARQREIIEARQRDFIAAWHREHGATQ